MDGEYSKLEKDFLGNERMVHYNAEGIAVSASTVSRADDGSMTVGEPSPLEAKSAPVPVPQATADSKPASLPTGTLATIGIASFVVTVLLALAVLNAKKVQSASERFNSTVYRSPIPQTQPPDPERVPGPQQFDFPVPQDNDPTQPPPDQSPLPPGDDDRPRIDLREDSPSPDSHPDSVNPGTQKPKDGAKPPSDPIDLRGDENR